MHSWWRPFGLLIVAIVACGSGHAFAQSAPPTKATLRLDWKSGAQHAPFYLAKERGYYKDEGIDLDIISGSGSSDVVKQVGSNAIQFGVADALVLVQAAEQRVPLTAIAAYYQRTPIVVISPQATASSSGRRRAARPFRV
jgi:NitT/TauT family transport system substrate-binding protein